MSTSGTMVDPHVASLWPPVMVMVEFAAYDTQDTGLALKPVGNVKDEHKLAQPTVAIGAGVGVEGAIPMGWVLVVEVAIDDVLDRVDDEEVLRDEVDPVREDVGLGVEVTLVLEVEELVEELDSNGAGKERIEEVDEVRGRAEEDKIETEGWVLVTVDCSARVDPERLASWEYSTRSAASSLAISSLIADAGSAAASWRRSLLTHVVAAAALPSRDARRIGAAKCIAMANDGQAEAK